MWSARLTVGRQLVLESWRIVVARENSPQAHMEISANVAFPIRGLHAAEPDGPGCASMWDGVSRHGRAHIDGGVAYVE